MMLRARIHPIFWFWSWDFVVGSVRQAIAVGGWALRAGGRLAGDLRLRGHGLATQGEGCRAAGRRRGARARGRRGQRMWEGDVVLDCLEDRRIALEASCCPCYRFGKNMRRANLGSCFLQVMEEAALIDHVRSLFGYITVRLERKILS